MKDKERKEYPDIEGFTPDGWKILKENEVPDYIKEAEECAGENIHKRGGMRSGAGRPIGSKNEPTKQIRLPEDIVEWIQADKDNNLVKIRHLITGS
jgi:hypothetical protein